ncbi:hypothetical protein [Chamaesiphon minutus]|uniref:Phage infection protein n=1 Tax=Chamaesiphon minutus (strain ATCC 27169 / PCC 6605) TaxID=1173020 RepID=K9UM28_CHAP6|nr:hypothetical protein [Chamaesiphon minutus]AFY95700.1 hypothetical protein Cha6605_4785 [Chamaesiphon minutus PCC 6605]AFY95701.1 hypothetical protein Cha6605_4786 [Chamaesiphon minutus PCC 6605]AFY95713.1 hypothetical protein Cha6605_4798 [Chamaesiphon minutus PCC 6605]
MNFKSILVLGLGVATLGLTLPAHADTANVNTSSQTTVITGNKNKIDQRNTSTIRNTGIGRPTFESTGSSNDNAQAVDVFGNRNRVEQKNTSDIKNVRVNPRRY